MAYKCDIEITIGKMTLDFCHEVECVESLTELTNTATIVLPKKVTLVQNNSPKNIDEVVKVGDAVEIKIGYNGTLFTEFVGYVSQSPMPIAPFVIECQDEMWKLKRKSVKNKSWSSASLKDVIAHIAPEYTNDLLDAELGKFIIGLKGQETAAHVLKRLNDDYGLKCFFRLDATNKPILVCAKPYMWALNENAPNLGTATYCLAGKDCNVKGNNLKYARGDERLITVTAKLILATGKTKTAKFKGDDNGETHTLHYYNISESELEKRAREDWQKMKKDGYEGTVTGFGLPLTRAGYKLRIIDQLFEKRDDYFFIDKVEAKFGQNGIERINTIGYKAQ
jgi:hypothetical protein